MTIRIVPILFASSMFLTVGLSAQERLTDAALHDTFARWSTEHRIAGLAAGRFENGSSSIVTGGLLRLGGTAPVTDSTEFEIGSITKAFTGILLADMVLKHEVALDDPLSKYLKDWTLPKFEGREITLLDLATHTSGLSSLPANFKPANNDDPYADYTVAMLREYLAHALLIRAPGAKYEYSNMGMALVGHALAARAGKSYEELLRTRVLNPLGMADTRFGTEGAGAARNASGHTKDLVVTADWHLPAFAAAGALHSNVPDLLRLAAAVSDTTKGPLAKAIAFAITPRRPYNGTDSIGLAWHHLHVNGTDITWHNGGTGGFSSFLGVDIVHHRASVVLSNRAGGVADPVAVRLVANLPLFDPEAPRVEIALPASSLQRLVGRYELTPQFIITITSEGEHLYEQATGQGRLEIFATSPTAFFMKAVAAEMLFRTDAAGAVTGLVLRQGGLEQAARRLP